jgi:anaerobic C4-dicarboxylate transporter
MKILTKDEYREINESTEKEKLEKRERQKNTPKQSIYNTWWFVGVFLPLLFLLIYFGITTLMGVEMPLNEEKIPLKASLIILDFIILLPYLFNFLMVFMAFSLNRKVTGEVFCLSIVFAYFSPDLFGLLPLIFGIAWLVKTFREKRPEKIEAEQKLKNLNKKRN